MDQQRRTIFGTRYLERCEENLGPRGGQIRPGEQRPLSQARAPGQHG